MNVLFYLPVKRLFFGKNPDNPMDNQKCKSSAIESWKRKEIKYSKIDTDECSNKEDNRKSYFRIEKVHKEIPDSNRTTETFYRFGPFCRNSRSNNPLHESS